MRLFEYNSIYFAGIIVKKIVLLNYPSRRRGRGADAKPFDESHCFSRANRLLREELGYNEGIDWSLE